MLTLKKEWNERKALHAEANKLFSEAEKIYKQWEDFEQKNSLKLYTIEKLDIKSGNTLLKSYKNLIRKSDKLYEKSDKLFINAVLATFGNVEIVRNGNVWVVNNERYE